METDPEVSGDGNSYTTMFRQYDPRLGRWKSLDPLMLKYVNRSPYHAFNDNPIYFTDPLGLEGGPADNGNLQKYEAVGKGIDWDRPLENGDFDGGDLDVVPIVTKLTFFEKVRIAYKRISAKLGEDRAKAFIQAKVNNYLNNRRKVDDFNDYVENGNLWSLWSRFDQWMKSIPDPDLKGNTKKGWLDGNGSSGGWNGWQYTSGEDGNGAALKGTVKSKWEKGQPVYVDATYMPGTLAGGGPGGSKYRGNVKVKIQYKGKVREFNMWTKLDIDDIDDLFDTDGAEIFNAIAHGVDYILGQFGGDEGDSEGGYEEHEPTDSGYGAQESVLQSPDYGIEVDSIRAQSNGVWYMVGPDSSGHNDGFPTPSNSRIIK